MSDKPTCKTCDYWSPYLPTEGHCHRSPPLVFQDGENSFVTVWPIVASGKWCGEHPDFNKDKP